MAWTALWTESTIYLGGYDLISDSELPNLKYLLADLCNAINERRDLVGSRYAFPVADGSNDAPVAADFVGLPVEANTGNDLHILFESLVSTVEDFFTGPTYNVWYKPDFSAKWTWATALAEVGIAEEDLDRSRALTKTSYESLKSLIELCRYAIAENISISYSGNSTSYASENKVGSSYPIPYVGQDPSYDGGVPNSADDAWGEIERFTESGSDNPNLGYSLSRVGRVTIPVSDYWPEWYLAFKTSDSVAFSLDYSGAFSSGTLVHYLATVTAITTGSTPSSILSVEDLTGTLAGEAFTYTPAEPFHDSQDFEIEITTDSPTLAIDIPASAPITFDLSGGDEFSDYGFGLSVTLSSADAYYDMNSAYTYGG